MTRTTCICNIQTMELSTIPDKDGDVAVVTIYCPLSGGYVCVTESIGCDGQSSGREINHAPDWDKLMGYVKDQQVMDIFETIEDLGISLRGEYCKPRRRA